MNELRKAYVVLQGGKSNRRISLVTEVEELADQMVDSLPHTFKETHTLITRKSADMLGVS